MKVTPIPSPLVGERVLEVEPVPANQLDAGWHRRLRLTTGRSLTDIALTAEQDGRSGRLATRGQAVTEGVVAGLDVVLAFGGTLSFPLPAIGIENELGSVQVAPGQGLTAGGEDVNVFAPFEVPLTAITVVGAPLTDVDGEPYDPTFGQLLRARPRPGAWILALEPVEIEAVGRAMSEGQFSASPCEQDPSDDPFSDIQRIDGCRLVLLAWPDEVLGPCPTWSSHNRNLLAHHVFDLERTRGPDEPMPWAVWAVPLALVGVCPGDGPGLFLDTWTVRRAGGRPRARTPLVPGSGTPTLWQARYEQFADHLAALPVDPAEGAWTRFVHLPPLGVLPRELATLEMGPPEDAPRVAVPFFPAGIAVEAAPIPLTQLDYLARRALALEPIDLSTPGEVKLLVPVAEPWFDPELLIYEQVHPAFTDTLNQAYQRRDAALSMRAWLREQLGVVETALRGPGGRTVWPDPDPEAVDDDELRSAGPFPWVSTEESNVWTALALLRLRTDPTDTSSIQMLAEEWAVDANAGRLVFEALGGDPETQVIVVDGVADGITVEPGQRFFGGWVRADVPTTPDRLQVHLQAASVYIVAGRLTPEIVDRALEFADDTPLLIVAQAIQETALLRIDRVREDGRPPPLVVQGFPEGSDQRVPAEDLAIQLGATRRPLGDEWGVRGGVRHVVVRQRGAWVVGPTQRDNAAFLGRVALIEAALAAATTDGERTRIQLRLDALQGQVAIVRLVPSPTEPDARWESAWRTLAMLRLLYPGLEQVLARPDAAAIRAGFADLVGRLLGGAPLVPPLDFADAGIVLPALNKLRTSLASETFSDADRVFLAVDRAPTEPGGIVALVEHLEDLVREADHTLDMGFLRVQGNTFRVRELLLGRDAATRMATSPILADVAKELQGDPSAETLMALIQKLKDTKVPADEDDNTTGVPSPPGWLLDAQTKYAPSHTFRTLDTSLIRSFGAPTMRVAAAPAPVLLAMRAPTFATAGATAVTDYNRGTGITKRITESPTVETRYGSFKAKASTLSSFKGLRLNLQGVAFPGVAGDTGHGIKDPEIDRAIAGEFETSAEGDEASVLSDAIASLETTLTWLRLVEARVKAYKSVIAEARELGDTLDVSVGGLRAALHAGAGALAEARHDVEVTRALLGEEQARVARLNAWRADVVATRVPFLVFCRPRVVDAADDLPVHDVAPALMHNPVLDCLSRPASARDELRDAIEMLRDAPARWFPVLADELATVDRIERMEALLVAARQRAVARGAARPPSRARAFPNADLGRALATILDAREQAFVRERAEISTVAIPATASWKGLHTHATRVVTVGDLVESREVRAPLSKDAAELIERFFRVTACLCEELTQVSAAIRLDWALRMSQFDRAIDLRELSELPRWAEVGENDRLEGDDPFLRQELQALVDWLYQQVDGSTEALAFTDDLVRVCFLLASHAPVDRVVAGRVTQPTPVRVGGVVPVRVDTSQLRIGMTVLVHAGGNLVARGVVEDLAAGFASSRIVEALATGVALQQGDAARFVEPAEAEKVSAYLAKGTK